MRRVRALIQAIQDNDEQQIEEAVRRLSRSRRSLAPLAFAIGALVLVFDALRLLVTNWRLTLVQILPAMWIWLAMLDLKVHVLKGRSFHVLRGPIVIPLVVIIAAVTVAAFFLNAVFAVAVAGPGDPRSGAQPSGAGRSQIRQGVLVARRHLAAIASFGGAVGLALGFAAVVVTRWGHPWFGIVLSIVVGVMMLAYLAVPARMIGVSIPRRSRRDKLLTSVFGGVLGATVCTPPYLLGRAGLLMLGSQALLIPGIIVLAVGATLQAGATGAVRAVKMSVRLVVNPAVQSYVPGDEANPEPVDAVATPAQTRRK